MNNAVGEEDCAGQQRTSCFFAARVKGDKFVLFGFGNNYYSAFATIEIPGFGRRLGDRHFTTAKTPFPQTNRLVRRPSGTPAIFYRESLAVATVSLSRAEGFLGRKPFFTIQIGTNHPRTMAGTSMMVTGVRQLNVTLPAYDSHLKRWLAPFVMASINTRIVHRTHALAGQPYGSDFLYDESMLMSSYAKAAMFSIGLAGFMGMLAVGPTRSLMKKFVLPAPGEGPSPEEQEAGFFDLRFFGRTEEGKTIETIVTGDRDPGYGSTAKMLGESATCLVQDVGDPSGGFPTPAIAFGDELLNRLQQHAGLTFAGH